MPPAPWLSRMLLLRDARKEAGTGRDVGTSLLGSLSYLKMTYMVTMPLDGIRFDVGTPRIIL